MKQGIELGVAPIKADNKEGSDKLRDIHVRINDVLYRNSYRYIDPALAGVLYDRLVELGKELNDTNVPDRAKAKKDEILAKLRPICKALNVERKGKLTFEDVPMMQKAINSFLHTYISAKNEDRLTDALVLELLVESRRLYDAFERFLENLKADKLVQSNYELLGMLDKRYTILV